MKIFTNDLPFEYELEKLTRLFFPFEKIAFSNDAPQLGDDFYAQILATPTYNKTNIVTKVNYFGKTANSTLLFDPSTSPDPEPQKVIERVIAKELFNCYCQITEYTPEWGILTGIRPAKLYRRFTNLLGDNGAEQFFKNEFCVSQGKLNLLKETARSEDEIISKSANDNVSVYISIPFCPSRCSYCSFVSHSVERATELISNYLNLLLKEIEVTANIVKDLNLKVLTVYIGGGTPTTLSADQLTVLINKVKECFGTNFTEFTVEAGRPDTITKEKLLSLKNGGVTRISINPQTMNDAVLNNIGRRHTVDQTVKAFNLARECGFDNINMDLIAGLPGDDFESFKSTINQIIALNPENVTVHSLSLKRSSGMGQNDKPNLYLKEGIMAGKMVAFAENELKKAGIMPYYMYRQSKTVGNLENVGYAKKGFDGLYNVYIMDETHTILACGASAVTKLKSNKTGQIERIFNYKYPYEYISNFDEILNRKSKIKEFYSEHTF